MPSVRWGATTNANFVWTPISSALGDLSNDLGTIAIVWRPVINSVRCDGASLINAAHTVTYHGLGLGDTGTGTWSDDDGAEWVLSTATPAFGDWYVTVVDWGTAAAAKERFHWKDLTTAAAWQHEDSAGNNSVGGRAGPGTTGEWHVGANDGGIGNGAQFALVAAWKGVRLGDANSVLLETNRRTSDWYNSPAGAPIFLAEFTSLAPVDLISGQLFAAGSSTTTGVTVGDDPAGGWTFDGLGRAPAPMTRARVLRRGVRDRGQIALFRARSTLPITVPAALAAATADTSLSTTSCSRVLAVPRALADTSASTTSSSRALVVSRAVADASLSSDAITRVLRAPRSTADTSALSDSVARSAQAFARASADTTLSTDATTRVEQQARSAGDTSLTSDAMSAVKGTARAAADTSASTDALTRSPMLFARVSADTSASSDSASRILRLARSTADTSLSTDATSAIKGVGRFPADISLSSTSANRVLLSPSRSSTDSSASNDQVTRIVRFPRSITDSSTSSGTLATIKGIGRLISDISLSSNATTTSVSSVSATSFKGLPGVVSPTQRTGLVSPSQQLGLVSPT